MEELILKEREVREQLVELVNSSQLPAIILKPMFKEVLEQLNIIEETQYNQAKKLQLDKEIDKERKEEENGQD